MIFRTLSLTSFAVTTAYTSLYFGQNLLHLDEVVKSFQLKDENDSPILLPKNVKQLMDKVMNDMKLKRNEVKLVKAFASDKADLFHCGFSGHKPGAYLAIPQTFFTNPDELLITFLDNQVQVSNNSLEMNKLRYLLCPSEKEQKFALANEIYKSRNLAAFYLNGSLPMILFFIFFFTSSKIMKLNLPKIKTNSKLFLTHIVFSALLVYLGCKHALMSYIVGKADYQVASLGKEYIEGGIEYCERLLKINKLIKQLNENAPFTEDGEKKIHWKNWIVIPIAHRINFFKNFLEAVNSNQKKPNMWTHYLIF